MTQVGAQVSAVVTGLGHYLPDQVVTTEEVVDRVNRASGRRVLSSRVIRMFSGVEERRYAPPGTTSSELAARAGEVALAQAGLDPTDIDLLLFAAVTQDVIEPATANIVQERLGCWNAAVCDIKNACNSFLNALDVATAKVLLGQCRRVLVTSGEVASVHVGWCIDEGVDPGPKLPALTVGDAGGAFVVEAVAGTDRGLRPGVFVSDGRQWRLSTILSGGTLMPHDNSHFAMDCDGARLHELGAQRIPAVVHQAMRQVGWRAEDVRLGVPHQTSLQAIEAVRAGMGYRADQVMVTVDRLGNTGAASIAVGLSLAVQQGRAATGDKVLLVGGAAGFSVGVIPLIL